MVVATWIPALITGFGAAAVDTVMSNEDISKIFTGKRILGAVIIGGLAALAFGAAGTVGVTRVQPSYVSQNGCPGCSGLVQVD